MIAPMARVPFNERGGRLRGLLDLAAGRYPGFLFGGQPDGFLPVLHFHEAVPGRLEAQLQFLADNGYRTVDADAIGRLVRDGVHPGPFHVALCFDDGWASVWTVAGPLLRKYGFRAILYAIPERMQDAPQVRPTIEDGHPDPTAVDRSDVPLVTWPELRALQASGVLDVQSHTYSHAMIFCDPRLTGFVTPDYPATPRLSRPLVSSNGPSQYQSPAELGAPLFAQRSRMSDAVRVDVPETVRRALIERVRGAGGAAFFERSGWRRELTALAGRTASFARETPTERERHIVEQLARSRDELNERLGIRTVRHVCLPWGVAGEVTMRALRATGYETAFSNRLRGSYAVRAGQDPFRLKRLNNKHLFRLPRRRRAWSVPGHA
jgi:Polysaccharide deacetylase